MNVSVVCCYRYNISKYNHLCDWQLKIMGCNSVSKVCLITSCFLNSLPNDKFLDCSKLKAFADNKIKLTEKMKFVLKMVENILGKGGNAGYQHFLLFPQYFQKALLSRSLKVGIALVRVND